MIRRLAVVSVVLFACAGAWARSSPKPWAEIRTPHFVVITDGRLSDARVIADHFERIRQVFLKMAPNMDVDTIEPVTILAAKNEAELKLLLPGYWEQKGHMHPAGLFIGGKDRNYVALRMDADQNGSFHVVYHEYVHLLESLNFTSLPVWASEGLAEFYAAARIDGNDVGLGYPIPWHIALLQQGEWIPLDQLLTATHSSPLYNENNLSSIFYAESWELTHYLLTSDNAAHGKSFIQYISLFEHGVPSLTAAEETIGDLHALTKRLESYSRQESYKYLRVKTTIAGGKDLYPSRPLTPAEQDAVFGDFYVRTDRPVEAVKSLREAMQLDPEMPGPYESLGLLALRQGNDVSALNWLGQAVALGSKDYLVYYYHATLLLDQKGNTAAPEAIRDVNQCLNLNSNSAQGYGLLAELYAMTGKDLDVASGVARRAIELKPTDSRNYATLAYVLLRQGKADEAEAVARKALALADSDAERDQANTLLRQIQQYRIQTMAAPPTTGAVVASHAPQSSDVSKPAAGAPAGTLSVVPPAEGFTITAHGSVARPQCNGKELRFYLMIHGSGVPMFAPDDSAVRYVGFSVSVADFPCTFLAGKSVTVQFRVVRTKPLLGDILEIDLRR
jgi:tetratricopeptide (TPR) repeat protein